MKRIFSAAALLIFFTPSLIYAQRGERIRAIKVGYLTDRLQLSATQSAAFWPVYSQFEDERTNARRAFRQKYKNSSATETDEQAARYIDDNLEFQDQLLRINKRYKESFLKVISAQQLATLYDAERDFKKLLLQQLRERRGRR